MAAGTVAMLRPGSTLFLRETMRPPVEVFRREVSRWRSRPTAPGLLDALARCSYWHSAVRCSA
ncbi:MAG: hypothetical protein M5U08_13935 [Burkholderiales bacterium]|nr:hypothetical protein [Burkholderiales bacterium]